MEGELKGKRKIDRGGRKKKILRDNMIQSFQLQSKLRTAQESDKVLINSFIPCIDNEVDFMIDRQISKVLLYTVWGKYLKP